MQQEILDMAHQMVDDLGAPGVLAVVAKLLFFTLVSGVYCLRLLRSMGSREPAPKEPSQLADRVEKVFTRPECTAMDDLLSAVYLEGDTVSIDRPVHGSKPAGPHFQLTVRRCRSFFFPWKKYLQFVSLEVVDTQDGVVFPVHYVEGEDYQKADRCFLAAVAQEALIRLTWRLERQRERNRADERANRLAKAGIFD